MGESIEFAHLYILSNQVVRLTRLPPKGKSDISLSPVNSGADRKFPRVLRYYGNLSSVQTQLAALIQTMSGT